MDYDIVIRGSIMARSDLDKLLQELMPFAQQMLRTHGEFHPYAAVMKHNGEIVHIALETAEEPVSSSERIQEFVDAFRKMDSDFHLKAVGIGFDVRTVPPGSTEKSDAVCIRLEHRDGEAVDVILPYRKALGTVQYGQLFASRVPKQVFGT